MGRPASAVVRLIECVRCHGYIALGSCACAVKGETKNEKSYHPPAAQIRRLANQQSLEGALQWQN